MSGAATYGLFIGASIVLLGQVAPQPWGTVVLWTLITGQLIWGAVICWRRTGLPYATTSMAIGAVISALFAILAVLGQIGWPPLKLVAAGLAVPVMVVCNLAESRAHPAEWQEWRAHMDRTNAWDMFVGRHIPYLRKNNKHHGLTSNT